MHRLQQTFAALRYYNFRLWFGGQIVSLFGTWMQTTAQGFLVYELTGSAAFLGYVGFASGLPSWLFMLMGGVVADRIPRRTMLIITQTSMMILAFILAALTYTDLIQPWHIIVLAFLLGVANAFDAPARLALTNDLVEPEDLTNAIALNGTMFNAAAIVGPALASIVYAAAGPAWCFTLNGISFLAVIIALAFMRLTVAPAGTRRTSTGKALLEGFRYVGAHTTILALISLVGAVGLFGMSFITLLPAWAVDVLDGDVKTNGLLLMARGIGALLGALAIASLGRFQYRGRLLTAGTFIMPVMLLAFSFTTLTPVAMLTLLVVGIAQIMIFNLANAAVQTSVDDTLRGRVMSIYSLVFFGIFPIGSFIAGQVAELASEQIAVRLSAILLGLFAIGLAIFVPAVRKIK